MNSITKRFAMLTMVALATFFSLKSFAASKTYTDEVYDSEGGNVSFPAGITSAGDVTITGAVTMSGTNTITAPTTALGTVYSASASLTLTAGTNVAAVVTPVTFEYFRVGKQVCAYGQVSIDPTSSATATDFTLSLPVVPTANFSGTSKLSGHAGILGAAVGSCLATNGAKTATCNYVSGGTAVELVPVMVCYSATGA